MKSKQILCLCLILIVSILGEEVSKHKHSHTTNALLNHEDPEFREGVNKILQEHKDTFKSYDKDGDGKLTFNEFEEMEKAADPNITAQEVKELFEDEDPNGDGVITQEEWDSTFDRAVHEASASEGVMLGQSEEELKEHRDEFDDLDSNKDGVLDAEEIRKGWTHADGKEDVSWKEQDTNGDGMLSFEEFIMVPPHDDDLSNLWKELEHDEKNIFNAEDHSGPEVEVHDIEKMVTEAWKDSE